MLAVLFDNVSIFEKMFFVDNEKKRSVFKKKKENFIQKESSTSLCLSKRSWKHQWKLWIDQGFQIFLRLE